MTDLRLVSKATTNPRVQRRKQEKQIDIGFFVCLKQTCEINECLCDELTATKIIFRGRLFCGRPFQTNSISIEEFSMESILKNVQYT